MTIDAIAAIGDVTDERCWSGIPRHFFEAAKLRDWTAKPIRLRYDRFATPRLLWNAKQMLLLRGAGGFQYSRWFQDLAWEEIPSALRKSNILTFHPFFPNFERLSREGGSLCLYFDTTHPLMFSRYGLGATVPKSMRSEILEYERQAFSNAKQLVFFSRWAASSAVEDCGADPQKVWVIIPGANLDVSADWDPKGRESITTSRPVLLGFIGKDWKRKGLDKTINVARILNRMGLATTVRCVGGVPAHLKVDGIVEDCGFVDKFREGRRFVQCMSACDMGCLFSEVEACGISILEFLRMGVPVAGHTVDGLSDILPPDAGFRIDPKMPADAVADCLRTHFEDETAVSLFRANARRWSEKVTWRRAVEEWDQLLNQNSLRMPLRPWLGLEAAHGDCSK